MPSPTQPQLSLDTQLVRNLRDHLLDVAAQSVRPQHGATRAIVSSPEERAVLDRFRPFAELFYLVAASDGLVDEREHAVMRGAFLALTGGRVRQSRLDELERFLRDRCTKCDIDERLEFICSELASDREDAELAFSLASAVALANMSVDQRELAFLAKLASWLRLSPERINDLLRAGGSSVASSAPSLPSKRDEAST